MLKIKNQKRDPLVPPISISALFNLSSFRHWDDVAINQKDQDFTRRDIKRDRLIIAKALLELGVKTGDILVVATAKPVYESIVFFLAANKIGAAVAYVDESTSRDTLVRYLDEFKCPVLVTHNKTTGRIKAIKSAAKSLKHVINFDGSSTMEGATVGRTSLTKIAEKYHGRVPKNTFSANKMALVTFTSGSTSGPKPLTFTNKALVSGAIYNKTASKVKMWDKNIHTWMQFVKLNYPYGFWVSTMSPILGGGKVILTPDIDHTNFDYYFSKNPDTIFGVPALVELLEKYLSPKVKLTNLKMFASGGERLDPKVADRLVKLLKKHGAKATLCNGYGLGEVLGLISTSVGQTYHPGTVGKIPAGVHVMVVDPETGEELDYNKPGIIYVNGKHMLTDYYNRPEINAEKFKTIKGRRYLITGDIASVSPTGFVTIVGRSIFFINNIPAKVYYEYVRGAIIRSDLIKTCHVVKGPDAKLENAAYAFVVLKDGVPKNNQTRRAIVKTAAEPYWIGRDKIILKPYEIPRKVIFLDELPLTKADKIDFRKLEKMAKEIGEKGK
ncbi:acyl--CoA ligase [Candidatus Saccharibacteria bacterium]|nr:acyl--CoA ligase [Candidatus Saccharibacteria bacterium]